MSSLISTNNKQKTVTILQPLFIPWLGFFDMLDKSDAFVILDNVQFSRQSWQQRNRIKTAKGPRWLTIPVHHAFGEKIYKIRISYHDDWINKHLTALYLNYKKAPHFGEIYPMLEKHYRRQPRLLSEFTSGLIKEIAQYLSIKTPLIHAKNLHIENKGGQRYVIDICKHLRTKRYLNGPMGKVLYSPEVFNKNKISLVFHEYNHPYYPQQYGKFISHLSVVDLLFNCGKQSYGIITNKTK